MFLPPGPFTLGGASGGVGAASQAVVAERDQAAAEAATVVGRPAVAVGATAEAADATGAALGRLGGGLFLGLQVALPPVLTLCALLLVGAVEGVDVEAPQQACIAERNQPIWVALAPAEDAAIDAHRFTPGRGIGRMPETVYCGSGTSFAVDSCSTNCR